MDKRIEIAQQQREPQSCLPNPLTLRKTSSTHAARSRKRFILLDLIAMVAYRVRVPSFAVSEERMDNGTHLPGEQKYMKKVLIPTKLEGIARETLEARGTYQVVQDESASIADLAAKHQDAYALIVRSENVTASIIDALPDLKVIIRAGSGYNTIDTKYARGRHVDVMNTPGANANAVAEEVVALMLADARHIVPADASARAGKWEKKKFMGREIAGKTVGIVGLGNIGQLVARRLSGFECTLLGYDPRYCERAGGGSWRHLDRSAYTVLFFGLRNAPHSREQGY